MSVSTRSTRHKPEVNRKEEMADQSIFKNLLDEALGPITQELKLLVKASYIKERLKALEEILEEKFEKRIKEQDPRIEGPKSKVAHLERKVTSLNKSLNKLEISINDGEQYSRRMCLRIDGIDLKSDENENNSSCMEKVQKGSRKWECKYQLHQLIEPIASANAFQQSMKRVGKSLVKIINK